MQTFCKTELNHWLFRAFSGMIEIITAGRNNGYPKRHINFGSKWQMTKLAVQRTMTPTVERRSWVASTTSYEELLSCPPPTHTQNIAMEGYNQEQSVCGGTFIIETRDHGLQRAPTWTRPRHSVKINGWEDWFQGARRTT